MKVASRYSTEAVFRAIDQFTSPLSKMTRSTKTFTQSLRADFAKAQRTVRRWGQNIKRYAWVGITALGAAVGYVAKEGIELASQLIEVQNVVNTTFGDSSKTIDDWSKKAILAFGLSELQAKQFTGTLGAALKSSGITGEQLDKMSMDLVGLAGDFASFYDLPHEEAFKKILSGMMGQTKPLMLIGKNMSVINLEAYALAQGYQKQYKNMTQAEKTMLRYNYLMSISADAVGDFNKTLKESLANQQRTLKTMFAQKMADVMKKLIPVLIKITEGFTNWLSTLDTEKIGDFVLTVFNGIKKGIDIFIGFIKFLKPFAPIIWGIIIAFAAYKTIMIAAAIVQAILNAVMWANPIGIIILAIGILIGLIIIIIKNWKNLIAWFGKAWEWIVKVAKAIWNAFIGAIKAAIDWIVKTATAIWNFFVKSFQKAGEWIDKTGWKFEAFLGPISYVIGMIRELSKQWDRITEKFKGKDIIGGIKLIGGSIISGMLEPIQGLLELLSKIPGVGDLAKGGAEEIAKFRAWLTGEEKTEPIAKGSYIPGGYSPISPAERSATIREENTSTGELIIRDETGRAEIQKPKGKPGYKIKLATSGGFTR